MAVFTVEVEYGDRFIRVTCDPGYNPNEERAAEIIDDLVSQAKAATGISDREENKNE